MGRQERKNMIHFITKVKEVEPEMFIYMTDEDLEHIYSSTYSTYLELSE